MSGTIPLSMTQQFTSQGVPLVGGKLYIFQTATTTPQNAYSDSGLVTALPNPITLDSSGRVPQFFLADGTIKVRLTDSAGVIQAEWDNLLVIGPSGGGSGGGSTVDATTIFATGDLMWQETSGPRSGWVRDNGRTIGSSTSGATERANSDCQALFSFLWTTYTDAQCPVIGGRGASASADWSANKQITLRDKRGYIVGGLADMGNSDSGRLDGVPIISGSATAAGSILGEAFHSLIVAELAAHNHGGATGVESAPHTHSSAGLDIFGRGGTAFEQAASGTGVQIDEVTLSTESAPHTHSIPSQGSGTGHNTLQPTVLGTFYRKL